MPKAPYRILHEVLLDLFLEDLHLASFLTLVNNHGFVAHDAIEHFIVRHLIAGNGIAIQHSHGSGGDPTWSVVPTEIPHDALGGLPGADPHTQYARAVPTVASPSRTFGADFLPSAGRPVLCAFSVRIAVPNNQALHAGRVELRAGPGANPATVRCQSRLQVNLQGVTASLDLQKDDVLLFFCPAGWTMRLVTVIESGAPTFNLVQQTEVTL